MVDNKRLWQGVLGEAEIALSKANFSTWFKNTEIIDASETIAFIRVPNTFIKEWFEKKYEKEIIKKCLLRSLPHLQKIEYVIGIKSKTETIFNEPAKTKSVEPAPAPFFATIKTRGQGETAERLNPRYTFDNFVVGNSNRLAAATAQAVATKPGTVYNPLFLYGGVGLGKTHLVQAIGNEILAKHPKKKIIYVSCERFTNDFVQSISNGKINEFKKTYRDVDVFLVDDIQFLSGKEGTQEEFFHTFNTLHQGNRQIVITSDRVPKAIPQIESRLSSRFGMGMVADIQQPNRLMSTIQGKKLNVPRANQHPHRTPERDHWNPTRITRAPANVPLLSCMNLLERWPQNHKLFPASEPSQVM